MTMNEGNQVTRAWAVAVNTLFTLQDWIDVL